MSVDAIQQALLGWYDAVARRLPWRVSPRCAELPDPYRVWLSEIMLQQTTVSAVIPYFEHFVATWPDVQSLAAASDDELMAAWAGLGYYARARNMIACARLVAHEHNGQFPSSAAALRALPGIGPYTAAAIAAIAFAEPATVVDGNVERVMARLFAVDTPLPRARSEIASHATRLTPMQRPGDHAQALMDLGARVCTARAPDCASCPLAAYCRGYAKGLAAELPRKPARAVRPRRFGVAFWLEYENRVLTVVRPPRGPLGGMRALPASEWRSDASHLQLLACAPVAAEWEVLPARVRHVFTHFELDLAVARARVNHPVKVHGDWVSCDDVAMPAMPTLFHKAWAIGMSSCDRSAEAGCVQV